MTDKQTHKHPIQQAVEKHSCPYTRFDLEDAISNLQNIETDLHTLLQRVMDHPQPLTEDQLSNTLIGLIELTKFRGDMVNMIFEQLIKHNKIL